MTKKRFVNKGKDIFQYGEWWCSANGEHCADVIATAMNELIDENEQLKKSLSQFAKVNREGVKKVQSLAKENEQLKQQHRELQIEFNDVCGIIHDLRESKLDLEDENEQLKQVSQDYEDDVNNWFIENWHTLSNEQKQSAHLELGIDIEYNDVE